MSDDRRWFDPLPGEKLGEWIDRLFRHISDSPRGWGSVNGMIAAWQAGGPYPGTLIETLWSLRQMELAEKDALSDA